MKLETLEFNGCKYLFKIHHENRPNSTVSIHNNVINIRIPLALNREEQFRELIRLKAWAKEKIIQKPKNFQPKSVKQYQDGEILGVGSDQYTLKIDFKEKQSSSARLVGNTIRLVISANLPAEKQQKHISSLLSRIVASKRINDLKSKIEAINQQHFRQEIRKIFFKNNKSNWGSCSAQGNINISTRLLFAPDDVLEYICIHELAHRLEFNHSDNFWVLVEKAMPNYREKEQWLKENGDKCVF